MAFKLLILRLVSRSATPAAGLSAWASDSLSSSAPAAMAPELKNKLRRSIDDAVGFIRAPVGLWGWSKVSPTPAAPATYAR